MHLVDRTGRARPRPHSGAGPSAGNRAGACVAFSLTLARCNNTCPPSTRVPASPSPDDALQQGGPGLRGRHQLAVGPVKGHAHLRGRGGEGRAGRVGGVYRAPATRHAMCTPTPQQLLGPLCCSRGGWRGPPRQGGQQAGSAAAAGAPQCSCHERTPSADAAAATAWALPQREGGRLRSHNRQLRESARTRLML